MHHIENIFLFEMDHLRWLENSMAEKGNMASIFLMFDLLYFINRLSYSRMIGDFLCYEVYRIHILMLDFS